MDTNKATILCLERDLERLRAEDPKKYFDGQKEGLIEYFLSMIEKAKKGERINRTYYAETMADVLGLRYLSIWIHRVDIARRYDDKMVLLSDDGTWTHLSLSIDIYAEVLTLKKNGFEISLPINKQDTDWLFQAPDTFYITDPH